MLTIVKALLEIEMLPYPSSRSTSGHGDTRISVPESICLVIETKPLGKSDYLVRD